MDIIISNSSNKPIYKQITAQIKALILNGTLNEGDTLPSMRLLAKELRISVITTKRAYEDLERDGFIETRTGKGSFVGKQNLAFLREEHLKTIEEYLTKSVEAAKATDISISDLHEMLSIIYGDI